MVKYLCKSVLQIKKGTQINGQKLEDKQTNGETPDQAIKREVKEELGIDIKDSQIKCIDIFKDMEGKRFCYNYIFNVNYKINEYVLQKEEVAEVKYFTIEELEKQEENNNTDFSFTKWKKEDFYKEMNLLKENIENKKEKER